MAVVSLLYPSSTASQYSTIYGLQSTIFPQKQSNQQKHHHYVFLQVNRCLLLFRSNSFGA